MSYGRMAKEERRLRGEIEALLAAAGAADAAEDARLGAAVRGDELPAELRRREDRLAAIRAAKSRLEAQQRAADDARGRQPDQDRNPKGGQPYKRSYGEPDAKAQSNFTDPESMQRRVPHQLVVATDGAVPAPRWPGGRSWLTEGAGSVHQRPIGAPLHRSVREQVAVGGSQRWIKHVLGFRRFKPAGAGEGAGRVGLGVPGVEHQAPARPAGGVTRGE